MSFFLALAALGASGYALLRLLRLETGRAAVDTPFSWFAGTGFFALGSFVLRFLAGLRYTRATAVTVLALPAAALAVRAFRRRGAAPAPQAAEPPGRWLPRPLWLFAPLAAYAAGVALVVFQVGLGTPTQTDDALRVRAFAPILAFRDEWNEAARVVLSMAGALPTYVPSLGWRLSGRVDHFHVNGAIVASFIALLALAVALPSSRGRPERGWAYAFAVCSLPLFVYHLTTTYADALLATYVGAAFLFFLEFGVGGEPDDALRSLLLLLAAAMVKREGELVAGAVAAALLAQVTWERRRLGTPFFWRAGLICLPYLLLVVARVAAVGWEGAFPFVGAAARQAAQGAPAPVGREALLDRSLAGSAFLWAVFSSGSAGVLYWILPAVAVLQFRSLAQRRAAWTLGAVAILLAEVAVTSLWLFPRFTVDQSTVHRQMLPVSVAASLWIAAFLVEGIAERRASRGERGERRAPAAARPGKGDRRAKGRKRRP
ncbi:MAG TPA: hypothetical protein VMT17_08650 [Anaeromyxobacteraceae bacterium]|nr:hypothetical protein [Anaeromyxobacteraceae bacterium]